MTNAPRSAHAVLVANVSSGGEITISVAGYSAPNIRYAAAIEMVRILLAAPGFEARDRHRGLYLLQYDDHAFLQIRSVAFGRRSGSAPFVELIVDPYFFFSRGFEALRNAAEQGELPDWSSRAATVFWRGSGSHGGLSPAGEPVRTLSDIPRVQMARRLRDHPYADVGLIGPWNDQPGPETEQFYAAERIRRPYAAMRDHAAYRYLLDIDGVANAWATLERFLCGSCVLKVETPFEMWFYPQLKAWTHYVPISGDLVDLEQRIDWCLANPQDAKAIAAAGRALALELDYESAVRRARTALSEVRLCI